MFVAKFLVFSPDSSPRGEHVNNVIFVMCMHLTLLATPMVNPLMVDEILDSFQRGSMYPVYIGVCLVTVGFVHTRYGEVK